MVRLYVSLLAVALVAGPALAFSDEYERRSELDSNLYERQLVDSQEIPVSREDHEYLYSREASDDLEARDPNWASGFIRVGSRLLHSHRARKGVEKGASTALDSQPQPNNNNPNSRREVSEDLEAREEELDSREFADFLEARRGHGGGGGSRGKSRDEKIQNIVETAGKGFDAYNNYKNNNPNPNPRGLEPNEDLFNRDLDVEEFFEREFDLDERDIFDDLD